MRGFGWIWHAKVYEGASRTWGIHAAHERELRYSTLAVCCQWNWELSDPCVFLRKSQESRFLCDIPKVLYVFKPTFRRCIFSCGDKGEVVRSAGVMLSLNFMKRRN